MSPCDRAVFPAEIYRARRTRLRAALGSGLVILPGASEAAMNYRANPYPFVQDSCFAYYFGLQEPDLVGLIDCDDGAELLFGHEDGLDDIIWHGPRKAFVERAAEVGVDAVAPLPALADAVDRPDRQIHFPPPYRGRTLLMLADLLGLPPGDVRSRASRPLIEAIVAMREIKEPCEIAEMEAALAVTVRMHELAMRRSVAGESEIEIVGQMEGLVRAAGRRLAYPIIFSRRGEILHNRTHENILSAGDIVINDAGATSPVGYASDITRTFPVGGRFDTRQREIYDLVLAAQQGAIAAMRPGIPFRDIHLHAARTIVEGLVALGLVRGNPEQLVADGVHALVFQSGLGHAIGLDTHDMESLGEQHVGYGAEFDRSDQFGLNHLRLAKRLEAGMVVTVEPGIYFIEALIDRWESERRFGDQVNWPALRKFVGFGGIRIEDDVLVENGGTRILSNDLARTADEVEALMS
jgi:Xaa-Pro aminopeptidase/Xaa-Pro dipeptidase